MLFGGVAAVFNLTHILRALRIFVCILRVARSLLSRTFYKC